MFRETCTMISNNWWLILLVFAIMVVAANSGALAAPKMLGFRSENDDESDADDDADGDDADGDDIGDAGNASSAPYEGAVRPSNPMGKNEHPASIKETEEPYALGDKRIPQDCFPKDQLTPSELLPSNEATKFSSNNVADKELSGVNFMTDKYHIGVNTTGQTLRNANRQLRSEPPNPQVKISPFMQTTIGPDTNRQPLEIGGCT